MPDPDLAARFAAALRAIRDAYDTGRISDTIRDVRITFLFDRFAAAPNRDRQLAVLAAIESLCAA